MSDEQQEILDEIAGLETKIDRLCAVFVQCTTDILEAVKLNTDAIQELGEVQALARSPSEEDLKRSATLREAYDRYDFVRKLAIGDNKNDK